MSPSHLATSYSVKVVRRLFRFSVTDLFSLKLILKIDPIEGLVLQVLLRIPQLFYNREKQTTVIRVSIMVLYNGVDRVRIGSDPHPFGGSGSASRACQPGSD